MDHVITVEPGQFGGIGLTCSCDPGGFLAFYPVLITLDELTAFAHEHITDAERAERKRT